ncbi:MAG: hypothetical protein L0H41_14785 [Microlunatus sp.]|nr:hypothetical protein [Microlunatus sp.]MDN5803637.1 hypothetical protein [Microlunatus sp.]
MDGRDRATIVLGVAGIASIVFVFFGGPFRFVPLPWGWMAIFGVLVGVFAVVAGLSGRRWLVVLAGAIFGAGILVGLVLLLTGAAGFWKASVGVLSLWSGLGMGLLALGLTPERTRSAVDPPAADRD